MAHAAPHSEAGQVRTLPLVASYTEPPDTIDGAGCNNLGLDQPAPTVGADTCRVYFKGASTFTGGIDGRETYNLGSWQDPRGGLAYEGPVMFDATVRGCGKGTFQMQVTEGFIDAKTFNFDGSGGEKGYNLWRVLPSTATGELAGRLLGGSGETNWTLHTLEPDDDFGVGTFTGTLTCAVQR